MFLWFRKKKKKKKLNLHLVVQLLYHVANTQDGINLQVKRQKHTPVTRYVQRQVYKLWANIHWRNITITVRRLGKIIQGFFFRSIRSQHSQSRLEMVCMERFVSQGLLPLDRKLSPLRFLSGLLRFAPTNCPWVSEDVPSRTKQTSAITGPHLVPHAGNRYYITGVT